MSKKGVSKISGNPSPKVGEVATYTVTEWYPSTPQNQRNPANVTWELFKKRANGRFTTTNIKKTGFGTFTFGEVAQKHTYRLEAYLFEPEGSGASTIIINPQPAAVPKIEKVELQYGDDSPGTVFSFREKMRARAQCVNLNGKKLKFTLWEDDETGEGHNAKNLLIETKEATVDRTGVATVEFMLTRALMQKAMQGEFDVKQLEFYVTVEYFSHKKHATDNVNVNNPLQTPASTPQPRPQQPTSNPTPPPQSTPETPSNNIQPRAENSPAAEKPASQMEERGVVGENTTSPDEELNDYKETKGTIEAEQPPTPQSNEGKTVSIVQDSSVEELLDAYFAKKEYTKQTGETAGALEYKFGSNGNKTATDAEKEKIAKIILGKPAVKALTDKKEYTTLEAIKQALSKEVYNKDETISFQTFKLGAELKKITSAPLDTKLYLVAKTVGSGLSDKQTTIIIKEKDGLIKGSAGSVLAILEITEAQMDQATPTTGEVPGTEKSEFTGKIENGMVKIPVHLRPKSDDELKQWKEKLSKGKEDGEYTYKFGGENKVTDENSKKIVAEAILKNAKNGNTNNEKIADGKSAYLDDIEKALEIKTYQKDQTIKFKLYKKEKELLYLQAKAQGEKQHDKEFLKVDGAYFEVGKKCDCEPKVKAFMRMLRVKEGSQGESGYTKLFGHGNFTKPPHNKDMSTHPKIVITAGGYSSSAAGAYQIMQDTYKGFQGYYQDKQKNWHYSEGINYIKKYKISSFDQESQDKLCLVIFKHNYLQKRAHAFFYKEDGTPRQGRSKFNDAYGDIIQMIIDDNFDKALLTSSLCWASLPDAPYGQPTGTKEECKVNYEKFLKEEIAGKSDLHLKEGFLKEFGYTCCDGNNESNGVCPDDCSQCFDYADVWENPEISNDNHSKNNNRFGFNSARGHKGIDIVSGPSYKEVHSIMCGEVTAVVDWFKTNEYRESSLGNTLMIKSKSKDGKNVFILYCHLDKIYVKKGDKIKHGDRVALSGSTGNASSDEFPSGKKGRGIKKEFWHVHIEAATEGEGANNFFNLGRFRVKAEDYMKTKFDQNGNAIK